MAKEVKEPYDPAKNKFPHRLFKKDYDPELPDHEDKSRPGLATNVGKFIDVIDPDAEKAARARGFLSHPNDAVKLKKAKGKKGAPAVVEEEAVAPAPKRKRKVSK